MATPWYLEVVHVSTREKQQDLLTLLREVVTVTAMGTTSDSEHFVIFDCPDRRLKTAIEKLFAEVDPASASTFATSQPLHPSGGRTA